MKTLPQYKNEFLEYCEIEKGLSVNTVKNYSRFLDKFFYWLEQNKLLELTPSNLSEEQIWKYRSWLSRLTNQTHSSRPGLAASSQIRYLIALRSFLAFFHEKNIPSLPTEKVKLPKEHRERQVKFLTLDQLKRLLSGPNKKNTAGLRDQAILEILFSTGLRVAELVALDKKQVEGILSNKTFEISIIGKGGYPRTVYFSARAAHSLKKYLAGRADTDPPLFVREKGPKSDDKRLTARAVEMIVQKYVSMAGLPVMATPHTLRHTFATDLLNQGVDLRTVQEFLGHRNIATTQIYTHVTSKRLKDIHQKFHGGKNL